MTRWIATVTYTTEVGEVDVDHYIKELEELPALIDRGPDWDTLVKIEIVYAPPKLRVLQEVEKAL